jgi:hypothetical protein
MNAPSWWLDGNGSAKIAEKNCESEKIPIIVRRYHHEDWAVGWCLKLISTGNTVMAMLSDLKVKLRG